MKDEDEDEDICYPEEIRERVENGMGCYSGIGKGWYDIVRELDIEIAKIHPDYVVDQVKEKFGGLRYYIGTVPEDKTKEIYNLIDIAEEKSGETCDICGKPGKTQTVNRWIATRCEEHK